MKKYRAVLFDMDGVIVDNHAYHQRAWVSFSQKHQLTLSEEEYRQHINGRTIGAAIEYVFRDQSLSAAEKARLGDEKEVEYRAVYGPHLAPTSGLLPVLTQLRAWGIPLAVATSAPPENVRFTLDGLGIRDQFDSIIDGTGVTRGKPDPEIYLKSAEAVGVPPEDCLVLEDAFSGIRAGQNAGAGVLALATTHTHEELAPLQPTGIITDFREWVLEDWFDA